MFTRIFFLVLVLTGVGKLAAQNSPSPAVQSRLLIRDAPSVSQTTTPLLIVDGILCDHDILSQMDSSQFFSIDYLKPETSSAIFGCMGFKGAIIISTREGRTRQLLIRDFLTGEKIPAASILLSSGRDTLSALADEDGGYKTQKLQPGRIYQITVTCSGYKPFTAAFTKREMVVRLERDIRSCEEVLIRNSAITCWKRYCVNGTVIAKCSGSSPTITSAGPVGGIKLFPNPVVRGGSCRIEAAIPQQTAMAMQLFSSTGLLVWQRTATTADKRQIVINIDSRWSAGIYYLVATNERSGRIDKISLLIE